MRRTYQVFIAMALCCGAASAADLDPELDLRKAELAVQAARVAYRQAGPQTAPADKDKARNELSSQLQRFGTQRSFVGDVQGAMAAFDENTLLFSRGGSASAEELARYQAATQEDAINAIVREAGQHRIVILNEAHHVPLHRAFALRLARELRKIGYSWLAAETFEKTPFNKGYLALSDGYYSREPVFGNFLRDAAAQGWQLVQYEPFDNPPGGTVAERIERRESGEARNLAERIFAQHPDAKVFIYVGYAHLSETPRVGEGKGIAWMAAHLSHLTGLDPLTIDQTTMMEHTDPAAEAPLYASAIKRDTASAPFVLRAPDGDYEVFGSYRSRADMQVIHPRYGVDADNGRPGWLRTLAGFKAVEVPASMRVTADTPRYLYAYPADQPEDAVPADIVQLLPGQPAPKLMLPEGQYRYLVRP